MYLYVVVGIFCMMSVFVLSERISLTLFVRYSNDLEQAYFRFVSVILISSHSLSSADIISNARFFSSSTLAYVILETYFAVAASKVGPPLGHW